MKYTEETANYILSQMETGALTAKHIAALVDYFQAGHMRLVRDGKPGPKTLAELMKDYPSLWAPPKPAAETVGKFLHCPLPLLPGKSNPQARKPVITSGFGPRGNPAKQHDGVDYFYRWEPGDEPKFVGDGGCEGKNADGSPKWVVPYGTYALAAADGTVQMSGPSPTGFRIWVDHGNGLRSGYFHLERAFFSAGAKVGKGTALGLVGHNPAKSDGRHLHFEVSPVEKYEPLDPQKYLL